MTSTLSLEAQSLTGMKSKSRKRFLIGLRNLVRLAALLFRPIPLAGVEIVNRRHNPALFRRLPKTRVFTNLFRHETGFLGHCEVQGISTLSFDRLHRWLDI